MQIKVEKTGNRQASALISGEMTIFYANDLKQDLLAPLAEVDELEVDLSAVDEIDTSGLQVLMLLKVDASEQNKTLRLTGHSQAVVDLFELSNLNGFFGDPVLLRAAADKKKEKEQA